MEFSWTDITRRESLALSAAVLTGAVAGCTEGTENEDSEDDPENQTTTADTETTDETESTETDGSEESSEEETTEDDGSAESDEEQTAEDDDSEESSEEEPTEDDDSEQSEDDDSEESDEEQRADLITVQETYTAPYESDTGEIREPYTPRSTVTTLDALLVEFDTPELLDSFGLDSDGVELLLDGRSITGRGGVRVIQGGPTGPVTIAIPIQGLTEPGSHTLSLEVTDAAVDLPEGRTTASETVEFTVEEPTGQVLTEEFPAQQNVEIVIETNLAPGHRITTQLQTKPGEDPAIFAPNEGTVGQDGRVTLSENLDPEAIGDKSLAGAEAMLMARPAVGPIELFSIDFTISEPESS